MNALLQSLDDRMNPVLVKELRRWAAGYALVSVLLLFLAAAVGIFGWVLLGGGRGGGWHSRAAGGDAFEKLHWVALWMGAFILPQYTQNRVSSGPKHREDELIIMAVGGARCVRGKALAVILLAAMMYAAALPFAAVAVLMRGVDPFSALLILAVDFTAVSAWAFSAVATQSTKDNLLRAPSVFALSAAGFGLAYLGVMAVFDRTMSHGAAWLLEPELAVALGSWLLALALLAVATHTLAADALNTRPGGRGLGFRLGEHVSQMWRSRPRLPWAVRKDRNSQRPLSHRLQSGHC